MIGGVAQGPNYMAECPQKAPFPPFSLLGESPKSSPRKKWPHFFLSEYHPKASEGADDAELTMKHLIMPLR